LKNTFGPLNFYLSVIEKNGYRRGLPENNATNIKKLVTQKNELLQNFQGGGGIWNLSKFPSFGRGGFKPLHIIGTSESAVPEVVSTKNKWSRKKIPAPFISFKK